MPTFSLPVTLVANTNENVNDLNTDLNAITAALNTLDESNVANLAAAFTTWKSTGFLASAQAIGLGANTYLVPGGSTLTGASILTAVTNGSALYTFVFDPADWTANSRTTKLRIRWTVITNGTAPAITFTPGLYPATSGAGAAGTVANLALGTVIAGSTAVFASPALGVTVTTLSSEFNAPASGLYAFGVVLSGTMAANSTIALLGNLQMRQV